MLRHPFFGIVQDEPLTAAESEASGSEERCVGRRGFFAQAAAMSAGAAAFLFGRAGQAQTTVQVTPSPGTVVEGSVGQRSSRSAIARRRSDETVTTQALGEEGGWSDPPVSSPPGFVTTYALGEEGSYYPSPSYPWPSYPPSYPPPGTVTTYALGEEGAYYPPPRYRPQPRYTTFALGEEGGVYYRRWQ